MEERTTTSLKIQEPGTRIECHTCLFKEVSQLINSTLELDELLLNTLQLLVRTLNAEAATVLLLHPDTGEVELCVSEAGTLEPKKVNYIKGEGFIGWVAAHRQPLLQNQPEQDPRYSLSLVEQLCCPMHSIIAVPLIYSGKLYGVLEVINKTDAEGFTKQDLETLSVLGDQIVISLRNVYLYNQLKKESLNRQRLFETGKSLLSSLDLDELLEKILDALQQVVPYNVAGIFLVNRQSQSVEQITLRGLDPVLAADIQLKIGEGLVGWVAKTGQPVIVPDVSKDPRYINSHVETRSELVVPIVINDGVIGVFNLESDQLNAFGRDQLDLVAAFATQAALTIERARMHRNIIEQKRLREELKIARQIQETFLPKSDPILKGFEIHGINISSEEVGGDYFDFIPIVENQLGIAIADCMGKGIPAALVMAAFRASLRAEIRNNYAIRTIFQKVNYLLYESLEQGNYVTAVYGVLDTKNRIFTFSNAGHNPPLLRRANGTIELLTEGGMALGIHDRATYEERPLSLFPGDILLLYTDGISEAKSPDNQEFGQERLVALLHDFNQLPAAKVREKIITSVRHFNSEERRLDDLTLVIIKVS